MVLATCALAACGSEESGEQDPGAAAGSALRRIQDYGPVQIDGVTHIGDITLPARDGEELNPVTVGATSGGYVRTSERGDSPVTHTELFTREGVLDREFVSSGVALTDPAAGTAAWVEVAAGRHTLVLTDLVGGRELGRWPVATETLLTVVRGEEAVVAANDGPVVFRVGDRHPSPLTFLSDAWLVLDVDGEHVVAWDSDEESLTTFTREGVEIGSIEGDPGGGLSPDGAWVATLHREDGGAAELVVATVDGHRRELELDGEEPYGVSWLDAGTLVVDTGSLEGDDADADLRRHVCEIASGKCMEIAGPAGRHWMAPLMPNDVGAAVLTLGS